MPRWEVARPEVEHSLRVRFEQYPSSLNDNISGRIMEIAA